MTMPDALRQIDDLAKHLRNTMERAGEAFPLSFRLQLAQIVGGYLRMRRRGDGFIHPGMAKMGKWGRCSERQARRNFAQLKRWQVIETVAYPNGGRRAARFVVHFDQIIVMLRELGAEPSPQLIGKLMDAHRSTRNPDINPDTCPVTMSAGIHSVSEQVSDGAVAGDALQRPGLPPTDATGGKGEQATTEAAPPAPQTEPEPRGSRTAPKDAEKTPARAEPLRAPPLRVICGGG